MTTNLDAAAKALAVASDPRTHPAVTERHLASNVAIAHLLTELVEHLKSAKPEVVTK